MASKQAAVSKKAAKFQMPSFSAASIGTGLKNWAIRNRFYIIAFFIPVALMYIAYAIYGMYPFGEESVLALDLNAQYVYYFEALRDAFWGDGSAFYSWSRNLSGGFMGVIGYYLASPFTLIVMILPRKQILASLMIMILCKVGSASVTFNLYLQKAKKLAPQQATLLGVLFSMCAYMVIQTIDPMWLDGLVFLPLIALGLEHLIDDGRKLGYIIPLALMFIANFYIGYMIGIFVVFYFIYYLFFGCEERRGKPGDYLYTTVNFGVSTLTAVMLSAFMILPVYNSLSLGKFDFSNPDYSFKVQFEPIDILAQLLTCQYDSVNVQGSPEIYCGILAVVLLPLFFLNQNISLRQKFGHGFLLCILFFSMYIKPTDMWWHGGQVPNWLPYRYSFIISFILLSMAATALKNLDGTKLSHFGGVFFGILVTVLYLQGRSYEHLDIMKSIWMTIGLAGFYTLCLYALSAKESGQNELITNLAFITGLTFFLLMLNVLMYHLLDMEKPAQHTAYLIITTVEALIDLGMLMPILQKKPLKRFLPVVMTLMIFSELTFNAVHSMNAIEKEVAYSSKASYESFIEAGRKTVDLMEEMDDGLYRSEKTFSRCVNDNLAFGLKGLTHSSSVMNAKCLTFIETLGYNTRSYYSRYDGTTELADSILGIKYVIDRDNAVDDLANASGSEVDKINYRKRSLLHRTYEKVGEYTYDDYNSLDDKGNPRSKTFTIYQNPNALPIGYMVDDDLLRIDHLGNDNPFNSQNVLLSTMLGQTTFDSDGKIESNSTYYTRIETGDPVLGAVTLGDYNGQKLYTKMDSGDPTVDYRFTVESDEEILFFLKTQNEQAVNLWLGVYDEETGNYKFGSGGFGQYFETSNYCIVSLGSFEPGTQVALRLTVLDKDNATIIKEPFFYYFNRDAYLNDIAKLQEQPLTVTKFKDTYIQGTVTAEEGQILFTSIPYEPGWTVKVDGKKVETVQCLKAMIYVPLTAGTHTVTLSYTAPGLIPGVFLFVIGICLLVMFNQYDKKHNKVLLERARSRKTASAAA